MNVKPVSAWHTDTVVIRWEFPDGERYYQRVSHPPKATRDAHAGAETWNTCPDCGARWKGDTVPGVAHRTVLCLVCAAKTETRNQSGQVVDRGKTNAAGQKL